MDDSVDSHALMAIDRDVDGDFEDGDFDTCILHLVDYDLSSAELLEEIADDDMGIQDSEDIVIQILYRELIQGGLLNDEIETIQRMNEQYGLEEGFITKSIDEEDLKLDMEIVFEWE